MDLKTTWGQSNPCWRTLKWTSLTLKDGCSSLCQVWSCPSSTLNVIQDMQANCHCFHKSIVETWMELFSRIRQTTKQLDKSSRNQLIHYFTDNIDSCFSQICGVFLSSCSCPESAVSCTPGFKPYLTCQFWLQELVKSNKKEYIKLL
jgi:hypothetical protein